MKTSILIRIIAILFITYFSENRVIARRVPYFGLTNAKLVPHRFAPAKVTLDAWCISFNPDGVECFTPLG